jgi:hypothetical protein
MNFMQISRSAWLVASAAGLAIGLPAGLVLGAPLEVVVGMMLVTPVMLGLVGAILGASQWVVLRRRVDRAWPWIASTAAGLGLGMTVGVVLVENVGRMITGAPVRLATTGFTGLAASVLVLGVLGGVAAGSAQWWVIRKHSQRGARWIVTNALALPGAWLAVLVIASIAFGGIRNVGGLIAFLAVSGVVFGGLTSRALPRLGT